MPKSESAARLDAIQSEVNRFLKPLGFRKKGRHHNRLIDVDELIHVISFQSGQSSLEGQFCLNLGIFLPCVHQAKLNVPPPSFVAEYDCQIRSRLGGLAFGSDRWFEISDDPSTLAGTLVSLLDQFGLPFLDQFRSYANVLSYFDAHQSQPDVLAGAAELNLAIIHSHLGNSDCALSFLEKARETDNSGFRDYVSEIASRLGCALLK